MTNHNNGSAANDEFQAATGGLPLGELVRDLLGHRLRVPVLPAHHKARPQLDQLIQNSVSPGSLLVLEAPAGYGKTHSLVSALVPTSNGTDSLRWITLNGGDNTPSRFLSLLAIALEVPELLSNGAPFSGSHADYLGLLLVAHGREKRLGRKVLVLDNAHHLASPVVADLVNQLLREMPANLSVVCSTRTPLSIERHTLELEFRCQWIGPEQLQFSRSETFEFFREMEPAHAITSVAIDHLHALTEGWLTPLVLYRRDLVTTPDRRPPQETPAIERFLTDSVMAPLTPAQNENLRAMAELDTCSDELMMALQPLLPDPIWLPSAARNQGMPLVAMPGRGRWYRLNPLLQTWLRMPAVPGLESRMRMASQWFAQRNQFPEALKYALLSGDNDDVLRIAAEGTEALLLGQDTASLLILRKSLPAELLERSARLRIVYAWVHAIGGQFSQARQLLEGFSAADRREYQARICAVNAFILRGEGQVYPALEMADQALAKGNLSPQAQLVTQIVRASALCAAAQFQAARAANRAAAKLAREAGDSGSEALAVYTHARIELGKGALGHAEQLLRTGLDTAMNELSRPARIGETRLQLNLILVLWHQGRLAEADRLLVSCIRDAEQARDLGLLLAMSIRVLMCKAQGRMEDAFVWIGRAERTMHAWQVDETLHVPVLEALKAACWLAQGQEESARQALARLEPYRHEGYVPELFPSMPGLIDCLHVRASIARGDRVDARQRLDAIVQQAGDSPSFGLVLHTELLHAVLLHEEQDAVAARAQLEAVVEKAQKEHFFSPFAELNNELASIIEKHLRHLPDNEFTRALADLYGCDPARAASATLAERISDREQGVLELIALGLSNQAIADQLHISLHTVKTHARRINAKLAVKSRTQAIVRARELGLL